MEQLLSMKDFEGKAIRPHSSYVDIFLEVVSVFRNRLKRGMNKKLSTHSKTQIAGIGFTEPIYMEGKERCAKGKELQNSVTESVTKIGGSKRKVFDNFDDHGRGFQIKKQKMNMDSIFESKEPSSSVRTELKVDALYSVGIEKTENSLPRANRKMSSAIKPKSTNSSAIKGKSTNGGDEKQRGLRPKPKDMKTVKPNKKITPQIIVANDLPEEYKRKIENFGKSKATLVIQKELTPTDMSPSASRLSMPMKKIRPESFLNADEIKFLARQNEWPVSVIDPLLEEEELVLRQWDMKKPEGRMSSSYVLRTRWNELAEKNNLEAKDVIQVWSFRDVKNHLHFAIVLVKKGEHSNGGGSSQSSPPSTDIVDGERGSGSDQDTVDGDHRSGGTNQGTETKEEWMMRGNRNDENNSGRGTITTTSNGF